MASLQFDNYQHMFLISNYPLLTQVLPSYLLYRNGAGLRRDTCTLMCCDIFFLFRFCHKRNGLFLTNHKMINVLLFSSPHIQNASLFFIPFVVKKNNSCHIKHYISALISLCYTSISALRHSYKINKNLNRFQSAE